MEVLILDTFMQTWRVRKSDALHIQTMHSTIYKKKKENELTIKVDKDNRKKMNREIK
jgi:hypothetical protein